MLHRSTTWFWQRRQDGTLTGQKRSGSWWYKLTDLEKFIENGKS
ncbi:MAG: hypothetical protein NTW49_08180 [Bacteroidia bacterium]|nr:hypothetical protein [Bacteroidia bacterium]